MWHSRQGKAPPVDPFRGNDPEIRLDDWLPTLERAAVWNSWSDEDCLIQLRSWSPSWQGITGVESFVHW